MLFRELKPRKAKTKLANQRRSFLKLRIFNQFHSYKTRLKFGRRKNIRWFEKIRTKF